MDPPNGIPPLPAARGTPGVLYPEYPRPSDLGSEINLENLHPEESYYHRRGNVGPYTEIEFVNQPTPRRVFYRQLQDLENYTNFRGDPIGPIRQPHAPMPPGMARPNEVVREAYVWPHERFYTISKVKRTGRFVNPAVSRKAKNQAIRNVLSKRGLSNVPGTGPINLIKKYIGMAPKKGTQGGTRRRSKAQRKTRRQRRQRGGADIRRIQKNVIAASKLGETAESNMYYTPSEDNILKGNAMVIGPRYNTSSKEEKARAKYPYEECLFFFDVDLGGDPPNDYPNGPPKLKHQTPGIARNYRLHPNLYEHSTAVYGGKVCLGILGTWGANDWKSTMSIGDVLQGIMGILEANPGTYEPGCGDFTDKRSQGILYNQHTLYQSIFITCKAYEKVFKSLTLGANNAPTFKNANLTRETVPPFMRPFLSDLAKRGFSAINFLIGKIEEFIAANDGKSIFKLDMDMHHQAATYDFNALKTCLEEVLALIPKPLQKNIFKYGLSEVHRALYNLSKPQRNGKPMSYEDFVKELEEKERVKQEKEKQEKLAEMGPATCGTANNGNGNNKEKEKEEEVNETEYIYSNQENEGNNEGNDGNGENE